MLSRSIKTFSRNILADFNHIFNFYLALWNYLMQSYIEIDGANLVKAFLHMYVGMSVLALLICIKSRCYQSLVRSIVEYSAPVWSPNTKCDILKLEKI